MTPLFFLILVLVVLVAIGIVIYNKLITLHTQAQEAWSDIDVQLKRRHDLIPNIVESVKGYMAHEKGVLTAVTEARTHAMQAGSAGDTAKAENALAGTLKTLFAVAEQYPDLKANTNFLQLQSELSDTENKIQAARRFYNGTVRDLNTALQTFPGNMLAGMTSVKPREFFELDDAQERATPTVSLS